MFYCLQITFSLPWALHTFIPTSYIAPAVLHVLSIRPSYGHTATHYSQVVAKVSPHEQFVRDGADLRAEFNISVIEALSGFTRDVHLLNGSTVSLNKTGVRGGFTQSTNEMPFALVMVITDVYITMLSRTTESVHTCIPPGYSYVPGSAFGRGHTYYMILMIFASFGWGTCPRPSWCYGQAIVTIEVSV